MSFEAVWRIVDIIAKPTQVTPMQLNTSYQSKALRSLDQLASKSSAIILKLVEPEGAESKLGVVSRLAELGFLQGETVTVLRRGPGGREPIAVQIGESIFALRSIEASCIKVNECIMAKQA